jgi:hypothetical protein
MNDTFNSEAWKKIQNQNCFSNLVQQQTMQQSLAAKKVRKSYEQQA